jgi:hypothetical protein
MVRLSLAIALATALFGVSSAAPTGSTKAIVVSLPFSRATSAPNWKQAITADKNRASRFSGTSKNAELAVAATSVSAENVDFSYVTNVEVGTQTFSLIVDTGKYNSTILLFSIYCLNLTIINRFLQHMGWCRHQIRTRINSHKHW